MNFLSGLPLKVRSDCGGRMKRNRTAETEASLQAAEARLRATLLEVLPEVALSGYLLFASSAHNSHGLLVSKLSAQAESLYSIALFCVETRVALGLAVENTPGQLFLAACEEDASSNPHRRGTRKLAASLLEHLSHGGE